MFYLESDDGKSRLEIGYTGCHQSFKYNDFDFADLAGIPDPEPIFEAILKRNGVDLEDAMQTIRRGLKFKHLVDEFYKELTEDRSPFYYDVYREILPLEDMLAVIENYRNAKAARAAKKIHTKRRRAVFDRHRDMLDLRLLDAGRPYVCAVGACSANADLTVDHILALSRGGSDDIANLQFLCRAHNSEKGDRDAPPGRFGQ